MTGEWRAAPSNPMPTIKRAWKSTLVWPSQERSLTERGMSTQLHLATQDVEEQRAMGGVVQGRKGRHAHRSEQRIRVVLKMPESQSKWSRKNSHGCLISFQAGNLRRPWGQQQRSLPLADDGFQTQKETAGWPGEEYSYEESPRTMIWKE